MNPLKTLLNKVFETTPRVDSQNSPKDEAPFEWNPDEESVAPTSSKATSWKRGDTPDDGPRRLPGEDSDASVSASAHNLPKPLFEKNALGGSHPRALSAPSAPAVATPAAVTRPVSTPVAETDHAFAVPPPPPSFEATPAVEMTAPPSAGRAEPRNLVPLSDFEDVYRKAGIKSPVHGYGVERVYRLITSRRLVGLDRSVRRSALLTALDAAGVPASDVSQDAVLRRKALTAFEAEKALELQSLRSRNESRVEALQDTVETFTRQKQSQIERLAQGSTAAVRAQSDLEIRKRMEQDRLYRSLAYFVEPLPSPAEKLSPARSAPSALSAAIERFDVTIETSLPEGDTPASSPAPFIDVEVITLSPHEEMGSHTRPISLSEVASATESSEPSGPRNPPKTESGS